MVNTNSARPFLMLDRDGTMIEECHYLSDPEQVVLLPCVLEALRSLTDLGLGLVLATNQSGLGRGLFDRGQLNAVNGRMEELLAAGGVHLDGIYFCPHHPEAGCGCRKPLPGMIQQAASELDFDPARGFVVGDKACDVELGRNVGATSFLVRTGYGRQVEAEGDAHPDYVVDGLMDLGPIIAKHL